MKSDLTLRLHVSPPPQLRSGFVHIRTVIYILLSLNVSGYVQVIQIRSRAESQLFCSGSSWLGSLPVSRLLPPQSARTGGCSASLAIVDGLNEFHRSGELHPPIALLPTQPAGVEIIDVLNGGQQAGRVCLEGRRRWDEPTLRARKRLVQRRADYNHKRVKNKICRQVSEAGSNYSQRERDFQIIILNLR